jgi:hypothetical protein
MKKSVFIICLLALLSGGAFAQIDTIRSNKNEFSIGYGVMPSSSFRYKPGQHYYPLGENVGAIYATYTRRLTKVIGIGATYCFDPRVYTYYEKPSTKEGLICRLGESSHTLMFHLKINWLNTKYVNLYSKVGQGIMAWGYNLKEYQTDVYQVNMPSNKFIDRIDYAYQFVPIGVEIGTKRCAGFIQCGIGMEGMISIGFRYGLKDKE